MPAQLLLGKTSARKILQHLQRQIAKSRQKPRLVVILVGQDPASLVYLRIKERDCRQVGINFKKYLLPQRSSEKKLSNLIKKINADRKIHGLVIQLPLPSHLNQEKITRLISPEKDIDGFVAGSKFISPVHQAIVFLLKQTKINLRNKRAVILANSYTFADPLAKILTKKRINTNILVLKKLNLADRKIIKQSDIIITALGRAHYLKSAMVKGGCLIIDIGFCRFKNKLCGDVDSECRNKAAFISPVPGGIGPLTVAFLLKNLTTLATRKTRIPLE